MKIGTWGRVGVAAAVFAVALVAPACTAQPRPEPHVETPRIIEAAGYRMDTSPRAAMRFRLTRTAFTATVLRHEPAVSATDALTGDVELDVVYTPVQVRVDSVFRGSLRPGEVITLRVMGGTAAGVRYVTDDAPPLSHLPVGSSVMVWGSANRRVEVEPRRAITPYVLYRRTGDRYLDVTYDFDRSREYAARTLLRRMAAD